MLIKDREADMDKYYTLQAGRIQTAQRVLSAENTADTYSRRVCKYDGA